MLYTALKPVIRLALKLYFRKITVTGIEHLNKANGAVIVCNHPSAFLDPLLLAITSKKPLYFLAGAEWFGKGIKNYIFREQFNMIPVIRPWLVKDKTKASNKEMFEECFKSLSEGKNIIIFPEASSVSVPYIRELKTGAARLKVGAESYNGGTKEIDIIPVGVNYQNSHRAQTKVLVNIGEPIDFSGLDPVRDDKLKTAQMTETIRSKMSELVLYTEEMAHDVTVRETARMLHSEIKVSLGLQPGDEAGAFRTKKSLIKMVHDMLQKDRQLMDDVHQKVMVFYRVYDRLKFKGFDPFYYEHRGIRGDVFYLIFLLPLAAIGFALTIVPYLVAGALFRTFILPKVSGEYKQGELNPAFAGSLGFSVALLVFVIWYVISAFVFASNTSIPYAWIGLFVVMYATGYIALQYSSRLIRVVRYLQWKSIRKLYKNDIDHLVAERNDIIAKLLSLRDKRTVT